MKISVREWRKSDTASLAAALSNKKILDNLRDGPPYPYTEKDAEEYISSVLNSDPNDILLMPLRLTEKQLAVSAHSGRAIYTDIQQSSDIISPRNTGARAL